MSGTAYPAVFLTRAAAPPARVGSPRRARAKLWELNSTVHCSVIGTCLTTGELRRAMGKLVQEDVSRFTDHDLHAEAVGLCLQHNAASKLLQKALDRRHETVLKRFARLQGEAAVMAAWADARRAGEIPGAYWAVLTHPDCGHDGMRNAFGDVHMLSHLVGAANRADIRRLTALEDENAALRAKVDRQQARLQGAMTSRDAVIRQLGVAAARAPVSPSDDDAVAGLRHLVSDLRSRLERETGRRERLEQRVAAAVEAGTRAETRAKAARSEADEAGREVQVLERAIVGAGAEAAPPRPLPAQRILYVGGRPTATERMREMLEAAGGTLLSHDGGRHDHPSLLPGLIGQADQVVFPVDCVSHDAALTVKRVCRQLGRRFVPLRSSGLASFLAAVGEMAGDAVEAQSARPLNLRSCTCVHS